jgi:hypothetical protein
MEYNHGKQKLCVKVKDLVIFFNFLQGVPLLLICFHWF